VTAVGSLVLVAVLATQSPQSDSLRESAARLSDSALVAALTKSPGAARDAVSDLLARAARQSADPHAGSLILGGRIAAAYAAVLHDSLLVRQVAKFAAASPAWRIAKTRADSLRRAGVRVYSERGPVAAIKIWRRAIARARAISDTAGVAATSGNIGAAFARLSQLDSASVYLGRARTLAMRVGDFQVQANAVAELAGVSEAHDDIAGARDGYASALALRERTGDTRGLAADYNNLGLLAERLGDLDGAKRRFEEALDLNRREGRDVVAATNLVNLAGLASLSGDFARGTAYYHEALDTWRAHEQWSDAADALHGLGQLESRRGDYRAAGTDLLEAVRIYERSGLIDDAIAVRQDLAATLSAAGQLQSALDALRAAQRLADSARSAADVRAGLVLARADLASQLNSSAESERLYLSARALYHGIGDRRGEAEAQEGLGLLLLDQGDLARARPLLSAALAGELATGNSRAAAITRILLGRLSLKQSDTTSARRSFVKAAAALRRLGDPVALAAVVTEQADLAVAAGLPNAAESLYVSGLAMVKDKTAPQVSWRLHAGLGALRRTQGALDAAARELEAAIADIELAGGSLSLAERRSSFLSDKADVYVELALVERALGRSGEAFDVSERARAREMLELLARGRLAAPADSASALVAREQDLRRHIAELSRALDGSREGAQALRGSNAGLSAAATREALALAAEEYSELLLEMREQEPRHATLVAPRRASWRDVARRLAADEALVEYLVSDSTSLAFVITRDTIAAFDLAIGRHDLSRSIDFVRGVLQPRGVPRLDSLWQAPLRQLHRELIGPLEQAAVLRGKTRLTIVPHGDLHYLPFAALLDRRGQFLVERYEIVVTPSALVWLTLGAREADRAGTGLLALAPRPDALPASRDEVNAVARSEGSNARVLVGGAATIDAFRREAPSRRVIHLATLGVLNKANPLFSFVQLAPAGNDDGRLEVHDVFGLRLNAELVVLSACETALASGAQSDLPAGDDWVGLARAFLYAGASRVVASLWPVQDRATALLMENFYRVYAAGATPASALAAAQRVLLHTSTMAHPFYWAAFEVVGER
jgi:CHAT domain-containing protein/tetratricopeptide (TPR) repeat protein